jgi:hypothetical protein
MTAIPKRDQKVSQTAKNQYRSHDLLYRRSTILATLGNADKDIQDTQTIIEIPHY